MDSILRCIALGLCISAQLVAHPGGIPGICNGPRQKLPFGTKPTTFLFAHGLQGRSTNAEWYAPSLDRDWHIIECPYYTFNFPDVAEGKGKLIYEKVNIGQDLDIQALTDAYKDILQSSQLGDPQEGIVIVGDSRGAVTALNAAAKKNLPRLRAIIAIGVADTPLNVLHHVLEGYHVSSDFVADTAYDLMSRFWYTGHNPDGISPLHAAQYIDKELPILLVHAEDDEFTSINSSRIVYYELLLSGHNPDTLFLLVLPHGKHGKYNFSDPKSAHIFNVGVHAFKSWSGIPYNPELADEGEQYLAKSQPSLEEIQALLETQAPEYFDRVKKIKQKRAISLGVKEEL